MAKTRRAYTGGAVSTTTSSNIAASGTTSFTVTAATGWPYGSDPFFVVVEPGTASEEKILVTRAGSGDTTINIASDSQRGQDGTVAVSHSNGATVFPVFTALDADEANELASKWTTKGDLVSHGASTFERLGVGTNDYVLTAASGETSGLKWGQVATGGIADTAVTTAKIADGAVTGAKLAQGYTYVQTVYLTSSGTFTKATYPWLRAVRVKAQGGGGGGGSSQTGMSGGGGGGGAYAEKFVTDIAGLAASVTVTVGAGGAGGTTTLDDATDGGSSSFGSEVIAVGGSKGQYGASVGNGRGIGGQGGNAASCTGDVAFSGSGGGAGGGKNARQQGGAGGSSHLGGGAQGYNDTDGSTAGYAGLLYGGGGGGSPGPDSGGNSGGAGAAGIVIVELFA